MTTKPPKRASIALISDPSDYSFSDQHQTRPISKLIIAPIKKHAFNFISMVPTLAPNHNVSITIDILTVVVILYYYFEIGLALTFGELFWRSELQHPFFITINIINILILWTGLLFTFKRGYFEHGILVLDQKSIIKNLNVYSLINSLYSAIVVTVGIFPQSFSINYFKIGFLFRLYDLYKIDLNIQKSLLLSKKLCTTYLIGRLFVIMICIAHYMGLAFYILDRHLLLTNYYGEETSNLCWLRTSETMNNIIETSYASQYLYMFYWAINYLTSIAFGDIGPLNPIEAAFMGVIVLGSIFHFNYFIFMIIKILIEHHSKSEDHQGKRSDLAKFLNHNVSAESFRKYMNVYEANWKQRVNKQQVDSIMQILPPKLKSKILNHLFSDFLDQSRLIKLFPSSLIQKLLPKIQTKQYEEGQVIYLAPDDQNPKLYYLKEGNVKFYYSEKYQIDTISTGTFGILEFISGNRKHFSAQSGSTSTIYEISRLDLLDVIRLNESFRIAFRYLVDLISGEQQHKILELKCSVCLLNHLTERCPELRYNLNAEDHFKKAAGGVQSRLKTERRERKRLKYGLMSRIKFLLKSKRERSGGMRVGNEFEDMGSGYMRGMERMVKQLQEQVGIRGEMESDSWRDYQMYFPQYNVGSEWFLQVQLKIMGILGSII